MTMSWMSAADRVAVLTGAGLPTDSRVPGHRAPDGGWIREPALVDLFTYESFMAEADVRATLWRTQLSNAATMAPGRRRRAHSRSERPSAPVAWFQRAQGPRAGRLHPRGGRHRLRRAHPQPAYARPGRRRGR
jgi:hypothetical protein